MQRPGSVVGERCARLGRPAPDEKDLFVALLHTALVLLASVLVSSVVERFVPRVSLPLVQVALGLAIALLFGSTAIAQVDPELFLVLFIAPLPV